MIKVLPKKQFESPYGEAVQFTLENLTELFKKKEKLPFDFSVSLFYNEKEGWGLGDGILPLKEFGGLGGTFIKEGHYVVSINDKTQVLDSKTFHDSFYIIN